MDVQARAAGVIRLVLTVDAICTLAIGLLFLVLPSASGAWLGLPDQPGVPWALRLAGACMLGLAGLMVLVRRLRDEHAIGAAMIMVVVSILLLILDLAMPGDWGFLRVVLVGANAVFAVAFAALLWLLLSRAQLHSPRSGRAD